MEAKRHVLILGGGPAGLSAALWLKNLGLMPLVVEGAARPGGLQNLNFLANNWVLGQAGLRGPALAARFVEHVKDAGVELLCGWRLASASGGPGDFRICLQGPAGENRDFPCAAILVATGTRYRAEEVLAAVPGAAKLPPERIACGPWAFAHLAQLAGARVLIVGGGDNAFENARLLLARGVRVAIAMRSPSRAQRSLVDAVAENPRCLLLQPAALQELAWDGQAIVATLATDQGSRTEIADHLHVLAGYEPNSAFLGQTFAPELAAALVVDKDGYLDVDSLARTGQAGVYGAGDVCNPNFPSVVSAVAQGALAAKTIELDLRNL